MSDPLAQAGLYFDELNKVRVVEPEVSRGTNKLKEDSQEFQQIIIQYRKIADAFIQIADNFAKLVEKEKMNAIGGRNLLKSIAKHRDGEIQQMQALIIEKSLELERLRAQYNSLQKAEQEQEETIEHMILR